MEEQNRSHTQQNKFIQNQNHEARVEKDWNQQHPPCPSSSQQNKMQHTQVSINKSNTIPRHTCSVLQPCLTLCDHGLLPTNLSMGFSRQEYWSGCNALLQGIFWTQGWNLCFLRLLHCRTIVYPCPPGKSIRRHIIVKMLTTKVKRKMPIIARERKHQ